MSPPKNNAIGILAKAINKLEENPVPGGLKGLSTTMFDSVSRYFDFPMRMLFAKRWLFDGVIDSQLSRVSFANAYRSNPFELTQKHLAGFHGTNEKMKVEDFVMGIKAYIQIMRRGSDS